MKAFIRQSLVAAVVSMVAAATSARAEQGADHGELDRIRVERRHVEDEHARREEDCRSRFVVTRCLDDAKRARRQALEALRRREVLLDEATRRQRAAERLANADARAKQRASSAGRQGGLGGFRAAAASGEAASVPEGTQGATHDDPSKRSPHSTPHPARTTAHPAASATSAAHDEATKRAQFEARQAAAEQHREALMHRNAARPKAPASRLPVPDAPASSASGIGPVR
jgi:hypothetical protein